jgi:hypothetical protein
LQQQPLLVDAQGSFGEARLLDEDVAIDFQSETTPNDVVTLIATAAHRQRELGEDGAWGVLPVQAGRAGIWQCSQLVEPEIKNTRVDVYPGSSQQPYRQKGMREVLLSRIILMGCIVTLMLIL